MPPIRPPAERLASTVARMAPGTLGGTVKSAAHPVTPVGQVRTPGGGGAALGLIVWSYPNLLNVGPLFTLPAPSDFDVDKVGGRLAAVSDLGDVTVAFERNGVAFVTITFPAGEPQAVVSAAASFIEDADRIGARITSAGSGAGGLSLYARAA